MINFGNLEILRILVQDKKRGIYRLIALFTKTFKMIGACFVPTVKGIQCSYRFFFCSYDCNEPKHVHVQRERKVCKFWLEPVALSKNHGFSSKDLNEIRRIILSNRKRIEEEWDEHCG